MGMQHGAAGAPKWTVEQMLDYFPRLEERRNTRAGSLSGGVRCSAIRSCC